MFVFLFLVASLLGVTDINRAFDALAQASSSKATDVRDALAIVGRELDPSDEANWNRFVSLLRRPQFAPEISGLLLDSLLSKARPAQRAEFVDVAIDWATALRADSGSSGKALSHYVLIYRVLREMENADFWGSVRSADCTLDFLSLVVDADRGPPLMDPGVRAGAWRLLARCDLPRSRIRDIALKAIASGSQADSLFPGVSSVLETGMLPELRRLVRESRPLHGQATAALAYMGDVEIRSELENRIEDPEQRLLAERSIWQIDVQRSTETLLAAVRGSDLTQGPEGPVRQRWALRRAVEREVDVQLLRQSILDYSTRVAWTEIRGKRWPDVSLIDLKHVAVELAVLGPTDLPDVPAPPKTSMR